MPTIKDVLIKNRPNLSESSLKTYNSLLTNLYKKIYGVEDIDLDKFNNTKYFLSALWDIDPVRRKTYLASLVVLTGNEAYQNMMMDDIQKAKQTIYSQVKTDKQKKSWIDTDEVKNIYDTLQTIATKLYRKKNKNMDDYQDIQNYIILALLSGIYIPPRRLKDFTDFKIKNIDPSTDNYLLKNIMVFNSYKTNKTYKEQRIKTPPVLLKILKKWIKYNPTEYLLFDSNESQLSNVQLTQRLNKIFNNKISVNQLRHTFMSDKYGDVSAQNKEMANDFKMMGSSIAQEQVYIKI